MYERRRNYVDSWQSMWRNFPIKTLIRPILVLDGNPHRYVSLVSTKGDFLLERRFSLKIFYTAMKKI
jgi:hypothetical protein